MAVLGALAGGAMVVLVPDLIFHLISPRFTEAVGILRILAVAAFLIPSVSTLSAFALFRNHGC